MPSESAEPPPERAAGPAALRGRLHRWSQVASVVLAAAIFAVPTLINRGYVGRELLWVSMVLLLVCLVIMVVTGRRRTT